MDLYILKTRQYHKLLLIFFIFYLSVEIINMYFYTHDITQAFNSILNGYTYITIILMVISFIRFKKIVSIIGLSSFALGLMYFTYVNYLYLGILALSTQNFNIYLITTTFIYLAFASIAAFLIYYGIRILLVAKKENFSL